jgi:uroporphyrinogen III methyltransferase/synthase
MKNTENKGKIYLIGAGPGDPGLITLKGLQCIQSADVIVYDYLASPRLMRHARPDAEKIYVGKMGGNHTLSQEGINNLLVEKGKLGLKVARLKGGDPFVFGRGGEEAQVLKNAGIAFEIVPGVTSAVAAPAYAGIPITHRDHTTSVTFVTGHEDPTKAQSTINWNALVTGTVVFFMGVKNLPVIVENLLKVGRSPETPAALIRWGTTAKQKTVTGTLSDIREVAEKAKIAAPAIIVVGEVVKLRDELAWFENAPLFGKRIAVTRSREQASALVERLSELGADCIECPTIKIEPVKDNSRLESAIKNLKNYDWLIFTSVNGVACFFDTLFDAGFDSRAIGGLKTAVIGPATQEKLLSFGIKADVVPESYVAESVIEAFKSEDVKGKKFLLPRARDARSVLPEQLVKMGGDVDEIITYEAVEDKSAALEIVSMLEKCEIDMITFTSSSTVTNFAKMLPEGRLSELMKDVRIASIGPITSETASGLGLKPDIEAEVYTIPGLCDAILKYYSAERS